MLRINDVQKQYGKFMLQCSMEVKPGLCHRFDRTERSRENDSI